MRLGASSQGCRRRSGRPQLLVRTAQRTGLWPSSSLNTCKGVIVTITDQMAWRRERRVLRRVSRAAWRLEQAERERA
jgi:hypothetical protein